MSHFHTPGLLPRRDALCAIAGAGLSFLTPTMSARAANRRGKERPKSLIVVWLSGGASQLETWDPHPGSSTGGETKSIATKLKGAKIASLFPRTAEQLDAMSIVRSLVSKEGDHQRGTYYLKTGYRPDPSVKHPAVSAIAAHQLKNRKLEIPPHVSLGRGNLTARGGYLGDEYDAYRIFEPGRPARNTKPRVDKDRHASRLKGLDVLSRSFAKQNPTVAKRSLHEKTMRDALTMMNSDQLKAFELKGEPQKTVASYGDSRFGRGCLIARRLVETGVRAVEVSLPGFDTHADNYGGHKIQAAMLDPGLSALISDLRARDLFDSTLVLCISEFGRTPKINGLDGRDHWPNGFSCLIGGGGINSGLVLGETDPENTDRKRPPKNPIEVKHLYATVLKSLGIDYSHEVTTRAGRPIAFSDGNPIRKLLAGG